MITRHVVGHLRSRHIHVSFAETNQGQAHQNAHWVTYTHEVIDTNHKYQHSSSDELRHGDLLKHNKLEEMQWPWNDDIFQIDKINYIQLILF